MRRLPQLLVVSALALGAALAPAIAGAGTASPTATGWWTDQPGAASQPDGGFEVSSFGGESVAVAAVRFEVPADVVTATLTLQEADNSVVTPSTALQACATSSTWTEANPGPSADAPEPDCSSAVELSRDSDSLQWTGEVRVLLSPAGGEQSLMIVPADPPDGGAPLDPGFRVDFTGATLTATTPPEPVSTVGTGGSSAGAFGGSSPTTTYQAPPSTGSVPDFSSVSPTSGYSTSAETVTTTTTSTTTTTVASQPAAEPFQAPTLAAGAIRGGGTSQPWGRLFVLVPLSVAIGFATTYGRRFLAQRRVLD